MQAVLYTFVLCSVMLLNTPMSQTCLRCCKDSTVPGRISPMLFWGESTCLSEGVWNWEGLVVLRITNVPLRSNRMSGLSSVGHGWHPSWAPLAWEKQAATSDFLAAVSCDRSKLPTGIVNRMFILFAEFLDNIQPWLVSAGCKAINICSVSSTLILGFENQTTPNFKWIESSYKHEQSNTNGKSQLCMAYFRR